MINYDRDQEAVDWARAKIQKRYDFAKDAEIKYQRKWNDSVRAGLDLKTRQELHDTMMKWRRIKNMLQMWFIGGEGCVVAAFDERLPQMLALLDA